MPHGKNNKQRDQRNVGILKQNSYPPRSTPEVNDAYISNQRNMTTASSELRIPNKSRAPSNPTVISSARDKIRQELIDLCSQRDRVEGAKLEKRIYEKVKLYNKGQQEIDLHFLSVRDAVAYVKDVSSKASREGIDEVTFVTGKGKNSPTGEGKIKYAVLEELNKVENGLKRYQAFEDNHNSGRVIVKMLRPHLNLAAAPEKAPGFFKNVEK